MVAPSTTMQVSAVVVNFNGGDRILKSIESMERQTVHFREIIVVDNRSTDGSVDRVRNRFSRVRIHRLPDNVGLPAARNAGLRMATSELVLLNTHDVYMDEDSLGHLVEAYERTRPAVVCPRVLLHPEHEMIHCDGAALHFVGTLRLRHGFRPLNGTPSEATSVDACVGACLLVDRGRVLDAGGFDEACFFYFEDLEFSMRLRITGHEFVCEPAAIVHHDRGAGAPGLAFRGEGEYPPLRAYHTMSGRLRTMLIHYRLRTLVVLSPALALYEFASLSAALSRGWGLEWLRAWWRQVRDAPDLWRRRRQSLRLRTRNDRELLSGGPLPLAPGFIRSRFAKMSVEALTKLLNIYWQAVHRWIG
jgi:GT2 family glycosyltransferase